MNRRIFAGILTVLSLAWPVSLRVLLQGRPAAWNCVYSQKIVQQVCRRRYVCVNNKTDHDLHVPMPAIECDDSISAQCVCN